MANLMSRGMAMLLEKLAIAAAIDSLVITPHDQLGPIEVLDAVAVASEVEASTPGQVKARREIDEREYVIPVASLVRNGSSVLPAVGDTYAETINDVAYVFRLMPVDGKPGWDFTDRGRTQVRVRTKRVP